MFYYLGIWLHRNYSHLGMGGITQESLHTYIFWKMKFWLYKMNYLWLFFRKNVFQWPFIYMAMPLICWHEWIHAACSEINGACLSYGFSHSLLLALLGNTADITKDVAHPTATAFASFFYDYHTFRDLYSTGSLVKLFWNCNTKCTGENWKCAEVGMLFLEKIEVKIKSKKYKMCPEFCCSIFLICWFTYLTGWSQVVLIGMTRVHVSSGNNVGKLRFDFASYVSTQNDPIIKVPAL